MEIGPGPGFGSGSGSGTGSVTESGGSSTESSLSGGLKFGQKIYFEDAGGGSGSGGGLPLVRRGRGGGSGQTGQRPRCQVQGCSVDLSNAKAYYCRHKVCGMHSKSSKVFVAGHEQRFCQQCSRFHQLSEFDQEKRSCRRRLAGHNERRRKPQPSSLLSSRYGRFSQSLFGNANASMGESFLGDPMAAWPPATVMRRSFSAPSWQINLENHQLNVFPQGGSGGGGTTSSPDVMNPRVESYKGVADSNCALSLLSNHHHNHQHAAWRATSGFNLMTIDGVSTAQPAPGLALSHHQYSNRPWECKNSENISCASYHHMPPALGLGQISQPSNNQIDGGVMGGFELSHHHHQQIRKQFMEPENTTSRAFDSSASHHDDWSL